MRFRIAVGGYAACVFLLISSPSWADASDLYFDKSKLLSLLEQAQKEEGAQVPVFPGEVGEAKTTGTQETGSSQDPLENQNAAYDGGVLEIPSFPISTSLPDGLSQDQANATCELMVSEIGDEISDITYRFEDTSKYVQDLKEEVSYTLRMLNGPREDGECRDPSHAEILELKDELLAVEVEKLKKDADAIMHCVADKLEEVEVMLADAEGNSNARLKIATIEGQLNELDFSATALARESAALQNEVVRYRKGISNASIQCEPLDF